METDDDTANHISINFEAENRFISAQQYLSKLGLKPLLALQKNRLRKSFNIKACDSTGWVGSI